MDEDLLTLPFTDPFQILRYRDRQFAAELIAAALLHFDFFSWLKEHPGSNTKMMCDHFDFVERPADVMLTLFRANGFIVSNCEERHSLTQLGREHLVQGSPWYLGPYYAPIKDTPIVNGFLKVLRTGKPANWQAKDDGVDWHASMLQPEFAQSFTDLMNCRGLVFGQKLAQALSPHIQNHSHVLDVGGGSGIYSSTLVAAHPHLTATVLEQSPVDAIVLKEVERHGLSDRVSVAPANMFTDAWPEGADVILFSNLLHDWDIPDVRFLVQKAHSHLPQGGLLVIHGAFINEDKSGPLAVAEYSALLMNITQGKCYSIKEYVSILDELGFESGNYLDTISDRGFLTAVKNSALSEVLRNMGCS
jgi:trans-aconitate methyltransferase